ncbi:MAG: hypothetical protein EPN47_08965 [Acidobacteria bacterium]|nr:MAG: hypothetical protein EPN47_08965 [Acidobacteriota bacterium]
MSKISQDPIRCRVVSQLDNLASRPGLLLLLFAGTYFIGFSLIASKSVVSNDELFTLYIARLPHFSDVWAALATGAEQTPPFFYAISRADLYLFGTSGLALRLPELLAFALMCACLFHIVTRRTSAVYGFLALLFPFMTTAFNFVAEARAYALVLAFSTFGLLCWIWACEGRNRVLALAGLATSLGAAISCHYYAVLSLFPLVVGEAVRSFRRKRFDVGVWVALGWSLSPLVLFLPLIQSARKFAPHFWSKPRWSSMAYFYDHFLLTSSAVPLLVIFLFVVAYGALRRSHADLIESPLRNRIPSYEVVAAVSFLLIPVVGVVLAKAAIGAFSDRYALPSVIGLSIIVAWGLYIALDGRLAIACGLALLFCGFLAIKEVQTLRRVVKTRSDQASTLAFLEEYANGNAPIVISGSTQYTELTYVAPQEMKRRLTYLVDPEMGLAYTGTNDIEQGLVEMKLWAGLNVQPYRAYISSGQKCYVYVVNYPAKYEWIVRALQSADWGLTLVRWQGNRILFLAAPGASARSADTVNPALANGR